MTLDRTSHVDDMDADLDSSVAQVIRMASLAAVPWRNGAGTTRRIADGRGGREPDWTLSLADIETRSAFSTFTGLDRTAVVVGDDPVVMTINGTSRTLGLLDRVSFAGEDDVEAGPTRGATRLLNLMTRRGVAAGTLSLRHIRGQITLGPDDGRACVILAGSLRAQGEELRRWDTLLLGSRTADVTGAATVAVVCITSPADAHPDHPADVHRQSSTNDEEPNA